MLIPFGQVIISDVYQGENKVNADTGVVQIARVYAKVSVRKTGDTFKASFVGYTRAAVERLQLTPVDLTADLRFKVVGNGGTILEIHSMKVEDTLGLLAQDQKERENTKQPA